MTMVRQENPKKYKETWQKTRPSGGAGDQGVTKTPPPPKRPPNGPPFQAQTSRSATRPTGGVGTPPAPPPKWPTNGRPLQAQTAWSASRPSGVLGTALTPFT